jgi:predicted Zn-dependent protease
MDKFTFQDERRLLAAEGWLELGNWLEANEELENITPQMRGHPLVLRLRWEIYAKAGRWEMASEVGRSLSILMPDDSWGWIHWAFALHELKHTKEAYDVVNSVVAKFPDKGTIPYNLACYSCQLGNQQEAIEWLKRAIALEDDNEIRLRAIKDLDLEPLWAEIGKLK